MEFSGEIHSGPGPFELGMVALPPVRSDVHFVVVGSDGIHAVDCLVLSIRPSLDDSIFVLEGVERWMNTKFRAIYNPEIGKGHFEYGDPI